MWGLTDPWQATRIVIEPPLLRAPAVRPAPWRWGSGCRSTPITPEQWLSLAQPDVAVVQRCGTPDFVPPSWSTTGRPRRAPVGLFATVITLGRGESRGPAPDLRLVQSSESTVRVSSRNRTLDLAIVAFRQEQAWTG